MLPIDEIRLNFNPASIALLNVVLAFLMFGIALDTRVQDFRRVLKMPLAFGVGIAAQFVLLPAITFVLSLLLKVGPSIALGMILVACCPPGNVSNILTHQARGNVALSVSMTAVSNALSIVLMPVNFAFWGGLHPSGSALLRSIALDPLSMTLHIIAIIGIPFVLGIFIAHRWPRVTARVKRPVGIVSFLALIGFIVGAIAGNWRFFLDYTGVVLLAVALHDALALATGYGSARLFRVPDYDRRAITFEVGIRNAGLGLVLVFSFFGGLGGMAVVAGVWGFWDIIAGLALASLWARRPAQPGQSAGGGA
ncbi:bile acid:sodium symporter family protein [Comamonas flocculans]|uniref:Bile acid:sodium symporter family protein n=1 Tax=Comamonas flocculans TaxID=2597701 RepID=A0A5B8RYZ3_9BURK|nr:bile acid:sodium symporter family protein [Comamonas flocculans]QEA13968.1 bile acid:sodium symporter family protein [Comamonas flocculans]